MSAANATATPAESSTPTTTDYEAGADDEELTELPSSSAAATSASGNATAAAAADDEDDELEELRRHVAEMEEEAKLAGITSSSSTSAGGAAGGMDSEKAKAQADIDKRSVYVGQVDYSSTTEELQALFSACGPVERVTILTDKYSGQPKGFAYVEFREQSSIENAVLLNDTEFHGRQIKVTQKRTNIPAHLLNGGTERGGRGRGRGGGFRGGFRGRGRGGGFRGGYRGASRGRGRGGYNPY